MWFNSTEASRFSMLICTATQTKLKATTLRSYQVQAVDNNYFLLKVTIRRNELWSNHNRQRPSGAICTHSILSAVLAGLEADNRPKKLAATNRIIIIRLVAQHFDIAK
jgi:hypothetical protein